MLLVVVRPNSASFFRRFMASAVISVSLAKSMLALVGTVVSDRPPRLM